MPQTGINVPNYQFNETYPERNIQQNVNPRPAATFRVDDSYKLKQKWNLSFDGSGSMNVHDFCFRLERMAYDDDFPRSKLTKVLHLFLSKKAEDWYWVYKIDNPDSSWSTMKSALLSYFSSSDFEEEIREQIQRKFQTNKSFSDFALEIQQLNARLQNRLTEQQLIYRLCQNMHPALKNVTLPYQSSINTVEELRVLCKRYEKMWEQTGYDPRRFSDHSIRRKPMINELDDSFRNLTLNQHPPQNSQINYSTSTENIPLEAFSRNRHDFRNFTNDPNIHFVCWNCKNIGHRFQDCLEPFLNVFCFSCGTPNVRKSCCPKCNSSQENFQPRVIVRGSHAETNMNLQSTQEAIRLRASKDSTKEASIK